MMEVEVMVKRVNVVQVPTTNNAQASLDYSINQKMSAEHDPFYLRYNMFLSYKTPV